MVLANTPAKHPELRPRPRSTKSSPAASARTSASPTGSSAGDHVRQVHARRPRLRAAAKKLDATKPILAASSRARVDHKLKVAGNDELEIYDYPGGYAQRFDGIAPGGGERTAELARSPTTTTARSASACRRRPPPACHSGSSDCRLFAPATSSSSRATSTPTAPTCSRRVEHKVHPGAGPYTIQGRQGDFRYENVFTCIPLALPFRPHARTPQGPSSTARRPPVVVGPPGEEIFTDKYGRVKVQFHWDRDGKNDANSSCWVRVAQLWAGKRWGASFCRASARRSSSPSRRATPTSRSSSAASTTPSRCRPTSARASTPSTERQQGQRHQEQHDPRRRRLQRVALRRHQGQGADLHPRRAATWTRASRTRAWSQ